MEINTVRLSDIKVEERYLLSFPLRPDLYNEFKIKFPGIPPIFVNENNVIIFGIDFYAHFKSINLEKLNVLKMKISGKNALILNFNLKQKILKLNLYEKLVFVKKILKFAEKKEVYEKTDLDINMNQELLDNLEHILGDEFKNILISNKIGLKSALKLCQFNKNERKPIIELFQMIPFSNSHQLKIIEMVEEIMFKEKTSAGAIFKRLNIKSLYNQKKPQKKIIDKIFSTRYPGFTEQENQWKAEVSKLKLPGNVTASHSPFFEKKQIELKVSLNTPEALSKFVKKYVK